MRFATTFLAVSLAFMGCKKKDNNAATPAGGSAVTPSGSDMGSAMGSADMGSAAMGSGTGSAAMGSDMGSAAMGSDMGSGAGSGDTAMAHHAGMCPSTVFGSTTKADLKGKAVVVTVTADDKDAIKAVQTRAATLIKEKKDAKMGSEHDQKGTHGGATGLCPVYIPEGATATAKNDKKGVTVTITPKEKADDLKTEIDGRITKAADYVKDNVKPGDKGTGGGVGGGEGKDGMNHSGSGDGKGMERKKAGGGGGKGTGGGGGKGTGSGGK
jgi:hypothetical protein